MLAVVRDTFKRLSGPIVIALALAVGGVYWHQVEGESSRASCQAAYNAAFTGQLTARSAVSTASDEAKTALLSGVGALVANPPKTAAAAKNVQREYNRLFVEFNRAVAAVDRARAANPLPPIPEC